VIKSLRTWGPSAVWAAVLFLLSAWADAPEPSWFRGSDKVAHFCLYAVLGAALAWAGRRTWEDPPHVLLVLLGSLYGASDEWHQSFVPGRDSSPWDWTADTVGVLVGYLVFLLLVRRIMRSRRHERDATTTNGARPDG